jgi:Chitobiase/beta-hexosaminidase C-terminal domain/Beta-propeller repeat/NHL repeat
MLASASLSSFRVLLVSSLLANGWLAEAAETTTSIPNPPPVQSSAEKQSQAAANYDKLPLSFEPNQGQTDPSVKFISRGSGYALFLTGDGAVLALGQSGRNRADCNSSLLQIAPQPASCEAASRGAQDVVRMTLAGAANQDHLIQTSGEDPLPGKVNYFIGNDPMRWHTDLPTYARVRYSSVYPGVDLVYYGNQRQIEYDFVVAPGAKSSQIHLQFAGDNSFQIHIAADGDLVLKGANGEAVFHKPVAYQEKDGRRQAIQASFHLAAANTIGFSLGAYDHSRPLIIDPVLTYSTYLGGSGTNGNGDEGNGITVDSAGDAYVVGTTYSTNFPVTPVAFQSANNAALAENGSTIFITELNPAGTALLYSTYLGGSGTSGSGDFGYGIALDSANNVYVTGATYSTDFPVTCGAFLTANPSTTNGAPTAFVAKLSPTANALVYSTYLGGSGNGASPAQGDVAQAIAVDSAGDAFLTGYTFSSNFPVTDKAFQAEYAGSATTSNAFATKLNPGGTALVYSTYLGGSDGDYGNSLAIDASGDVFVAGSTASPNFPVTSGAFQTGFAGESSIGPNAFVTKLNPAGTDEVYSTYLGGNGLWSDAVFSYFPPVTGDSATAIAVDSSGFAYVAGNTGSSNFPVTAGALEGAGDFVDVATGFVTKLSLNGSSLVYSTYLEGAGTSVSGLAVDSTGTAYITGSAPSASAGLSGGFQTTPDALPNPSSTGTAAFLVKLNPSATVLNYATLLGGSSNDGATAVAVDNTGNAYLTGFTTSTNFPTTAGAFQTTYGSPSAELIPTYLSILSQQLTCSVQFAGYSVFVNLMVNSDSNGPSPTGSVFITGQFEVGETVPVSASSPGTAVVDLDGTSSSGVAQSAYWQAFYSGDSVYAPSTISGTANGPGNCDSEPDVSRLEAKKHASLSKLSGMRGEGQSKDGTGLANLTNSPTAAGASQIAKSAASVGDSNAFISKFVLATETNKTTYPSDPSNVANTMTSFGKITLSCDPNIPPNDGFGLAVNVNLNTDPSGPPPTGAITFEDNLNYSFSNAYFLPFSSAWGSGGLYLTFTDGESYDGPESAFSMNWQISYSGDAYYAPSSSSGSASSPGCSSSSSSSTGPALTEDSHRILIDLRPKRAGSPQPALRSTSAPSAVAGPKFTPRPATAREAGQRSPASSSVKSQETPACIAPNQVDTPFFSPFAGTYTSAQSVAIIDATPGATIYYTTDGTTPTTSSTQYTGPITVSSTETIQAIAAATGYSNSSLASATYTINLPPPAATPVFSLAAGSYNSAQSVSITDATTGATIYYTTDGTTPTTSSAVYMGAITVSATEILQAIAVAPGYSNSAIALASYSITFESFGSVNIGSSATAPVSFIIPSTAPEGFFSFSSQGSAELDFASGGAAGCTGTTTVTICAIGGIFTPKFAGTRYGAAELNDYSGNVLATIYLQGTGLGPEVNFLPGTESTIGSGLTMPGGLVVDGSGNLYIAANGQVLKETPSASGYSQSVLFNNRSGLLAVDGAGNLYIGGSGVLYKETLSAGTYTESTIGTGLSQQNGAVVDGSGNVYISDALNGRVLMETPSAGSYTQSVIYTCGTVGVQSCPSSVAVDGNGNLYITAYNSSQVLKLTPSAGGYAQSMIGSGLSGPSDVVVDGNGNLYIADTLNSRIVKETLSAGTYIQSTVSSSSLNWPWAVAVEQNGNVYIADTYNNRVLKEDLWDPPTLSFAATKAGLTSSDSPKIVTIENNGNSPLNISAVSYPADFPEAGSAAGDCKAGTSLQAGATCTLTVDFTPVATPSGSSTSPTLIESVTLTTNTQNVTGTRQAIAVTGTETLPQAVAPVFTPVADVYTSTQIVTITDATTGSAIYYTTDGTAPTTSSTKYTGVITVSATETIEAVAVASGYTNSAVASATYTIQVLAATPTFSPEAGSYPTVQFVSVTDTTPGATIYYTTNGTTPTTSSTRYSGAITVSATETIEAIAVAGGYANSAVASATYTIVPSTTSELQFIPVSPCRIVDTRNPTGTFGGPELTAGSTRTFNIPQSACGIPSTAVAYSLNATVVPNASIGYLTVYPAGEAQPGVSTLNSDGRVKANATITPAGSNGGVSVYTSDPTQFILDIDGYFVPAGTSASGLQFYPLTPCRIADTRNPTGPLGGPSLTGGDGRAFPVLSSSCSIPATAKAYSLNVTAVPREAALGFLAAWPSGQAQPVASTLNASTGAVTANAAIVTAGTGGDVSIYASNDADVILDINGYFTPPATGGLSLYTVTPCRVLDTRYPPAAGAFVGTLTVPVQTSVCAAPAAARAYVFNATVVPPVALGYLTLYPEGAAVPGVSTLNASDGAITSNMAIVSTNNGSIDAYATDTTNLILDFSSYFAP